MVTHITHTLHTPLEYFKYAIYTRQLGHTPNLSSDMYIAQSFYFKHTHLTYHYAAHVMATHTHTHTHTHMHTHTHTYIHTLNILLCNTSKLIHTHIQMHIHKHMHT